MFGLTFGLQNSQCFQFKKWNYQQICSPRDFYLPTWEEFAPPSNSQDLAQNLLSDWLWALLLYFNICYEIDEPFECVKTLPKVDASLFASITCTF